MVSPAVVRQRPAGEGESAAAGDGGGRCPPAAARPSLFSQALAPTASLANLLPTGTLLAPTFTNNGSCDVTAWLLTAALLALLALSCVLVSFTNSLNGLDGRVYYDLATPRGLWLLDYPPLGASALPPLDMSRYSLRAIDGGPLRLPPHCRH
uniref:Uncharacterized protein n=1 Tax=Oryza nivara TaxID=4536 RepID=A0A0E0H0M3_ORYNI